MKIRRLLRNINFDIKIKLLYNTDITLEIPLSFYIASMSGVNFECGYLNDLLYSTILRPYSYYFDKKVAEKIDHYCWVAANNLKTERL